MISNCIYSPHNVQKEIILVFTLGSGIVWSIFRILHTTYGHLTLLHSLYQGPKGEKANLTVMIPIIKGNWLLL